MAAATALVQAPCRIHLITDSEYVMNGIRALAYGTKFSCGERAAGPPLLLVRSGRRARAKKIKLPRLRCAT